MQQRVFADGEEERKDGEEEEEPRVKSSAIGGETDGGERGQAHAEKWIERRVPMKSVHENARKRSRIQ